MTVSVGGKAVVDVDGSPSSSASFGSRGGRFEGSGFKAVSRQSKLVLDSHPRRKCALESSASSSQRHSHFPKSSGMPHSASTIMGSGVSLASTFRNSGFA
jgi:hypothetical protein